MKAIGSYPNLVNATTAGAKTEVNALLSTLANLIPNPVQQNGGVGSGSPATEPEFDEIQPRLALQIQQEIAAIQAAVTNGA